MLNSSRFCDYSWKELRMRLPFTFSRTRMRSAICLPSSMAYVVSCSTFPFKALLLSVVSRQYPSKSSRRAPYRVSSGSSSILPNLRLRSPVPKAVSSAKCACSCCSCSLSAVPGSTLNSVLKDSRSRVTSSKKVTRQFCSGRAVMCSGGLMCAGRDLRLPIAGLSEEWRLLSSANFFLRKLFSRFSCSISMRQHRSSSSSSSESSKLCSKRVLRDSRRGSRGGSEEVGSDGLFSMAYQSLQNCRKQIVQFRQPRQECTLEWRGTAKTPYIAAWKGGIPSDFSIILNQNINEQIVIAKLMMICLLFLEEIYNQTQFG